MDDSAVPETGVAISRETIEMMAEVSKLSKQVVPSLRSLSLSQRIALLSFSVGGLTLFFLSRFLKRKRRTVLPPGKSFRNVRRSRRQSLSQKGLGHPPYNWSELQRQSQFNDRDSVASVATLVDGTPLSPQQLGLMGMEALETVIGYWEDALTTYNPTRRHLALPTKDDAQFTRILESLLEGAYQLQDDAEHIFIHQNSVLNRNGTRRIRFEDQQSFVSTAKSLLSVSTVDQESFVSAQDTIADLTDFDDLNDILPAGPDGPGGDTNQTLFLEALDHLKENGIPFRTIRTEFVGCASDTEYLAKLHCLRLGFKHLMAQDSIRTWWVDTGRQILSDILIRSEKDPAAFIAHYDNLISYLSVSDHIDSMALELESRNVKCTNFYDIVLDYILIDSFEDLESPPSSVIAVMKNRWLSNGFKESAMQTAIWSVMAAKRRLLQYPNGFKAQFYNIAEILTPTLAWGFFGPDEDLNKLMNYFKDQVLSFIRDLFSFQHIRFSTAEELGDDIMKLAEERVGSTVRFLSL